MLNLIFNRSSHRMLEEMPDELNSYTKLLSDDGSTHMLQDGQIIDPIVMDRLTQHNFYRIG